MRALKQRNIFWAKRFRAYSIVFGFLLTGCLKSPEVVKIGLVAPFEGRYRAIGYEVIPSARLAIREFSNVNVGKVSVELVAYDDQGETDRAIEQAEKLIADSSVKVVIGHWRDSTTMLALSEYESAGIKVVTFTARDTSAYPNVLNLSPSDSAFAAAAKHWGTHLKLDSSYVNDSSEDIVDEAVRLDALSLSNKVGTILGGPEWGQFQIEELTRSDLSGLYFMTGAAFPADQIGEYWTNNRTSSFVARFEDGSAGSPPGFYSLVAYEATWLALQIATKSAVTVNNEQLPEIRFDESGRRSSSPVYLYQWREGHRVFIDTFP